jgi:hypothetical protein
VSVSFEDVTRAQTPLRGLDGSLHGAILAMTVEPVEETR